MAMEKLINDLEAAFAAYESKIKKIYRCTCDWSEGEDQHVDSCPQEKYLRDKEAVA